MINKMTRYDFLLLSEDCDAFLAGLQDLGIVDITRSEKPVDETSSAMFAKVEEMKKRISWLSAKDWSKDEQYSGIQAELASAAAERAERAPWGRFDKDTIKALEESGHKVRFYSVAKKKFDPAWAELQPLEIISDNGTTVWFVTVGDVESYEFPIAECKTPEASFEETDARIATLDTQLKERAEALEAEALKVDSLSADQAKAVADLDLYLAGASKTVAAEEYVTVFTGFAPAEEDSRLKDAFDAMSCYWTSSKATAADLPPIKFKNNWFVKMFEPLTDMYGRPAYDGFDPTPYISIFFLLFFAMCMGDAGYGLLLIIVGLLLKKVKSFASLAPLVVTLGIGTTVVGFFFHTFFSMDISQWECIPDGLKQIMVPSQVANYDGTMVLALVIGIIHLCLAMTVKVIYAIKNNGFMNSLGVLGWTLLLVGGTIVGTLALIGVLDSALTKTIIIILGCVSAVGIFLLNDVHRNPLINIGSGLWEAYNTATGVLGDVLSYLRLYALGLAGGMLGFAFNDLAKMALGDGGFGWVPFILIVIIGHTLNLAMAALGAFVHPLRLNFLEFFKNSGYEGSGRKFDPLKK